MELESTLGATPSLDRMTDESGVKLTATACRKPTDSDVVLDYLLAHPKAGYFSIVFCGLMSALWHNFWCPSAMPSGERTKSGILPGRPSLDTGSREAEAGFEPWISRPPTECTAHRTPHDLVDTIFEISQYIFIK
ncbi:hypothetical protein T265_15020, partial [Opisthorchis viverrini]